jgi:hypothetical protein
LYEVLIEGQSGGGAMSRLDAKFRRWIALCVAHR